MKYTMCRKKGTSTILGTLIFMGILFSAVAPMFITMRQADVYYEQRKQEVGILDDEKSREDLTFYVYPDAQQDLIVVVENKCVMSIQVVRVWINNVEQVDSTVVDPQSSEIIELDFEPVEDTLYDIRVTTERGNVYELSTGELEYTSGGWIVESKVINVLISASGVVFKINLYGKNGESWDLLDNAQVQKLGGTAFKPFEVTMFPDYSLFKVEVLKGTKIIHEEENLEILWPYGPSTIWVYA
jgi:hypothetical protein